MTLAQNYKATSEYERNKIDVKDGTREALSKDADKWEKITVGNSAVGLTSSTYGSNTFAVITVEDNTIRFRIDGTNPTTANGHIAYPGDVIELNSAADIAAFKAIRISADAVIQATYSV